LHHNHAIAATAIELSHCRSRRSSSRGREKTMLAAVFSLPGDISPKCEITKKNDFGGFLSPEGGKKKKEVKSPDSYSLTKFGYKK
jgi:hypothetical protein